MAIDGKNRNDFAPDITEMNDNRAQPLTVEELRNRLKHIATLCWGLSIDLATEFETCRKIREENEKLRAQVVLLGGRLPKDTSGKGFIDPAKWASMTPEEQEKCARRAKSRRDYQTRKAKERARAQYAKQNGNE